MNVYLKTLGCRLNEAELERWAAEFEHAGCAIVNEPETAELVVINTCAVTREAVRKSRQWMRRSRRANPDAKLVVSGCYVSLDEQSTAEIDGVDLVVQNRNKDQLVPLVLAHLRDDFPFHYDGPAPGGASLLTRGRQRAFVKVQDGCRHRCTFCVVTLARGAERSRAAVEIIDDINRLHGAGIQEAVLTGVHLGGYGSDLGADLNQLLKQVLENTDIPRIRLGSLEPWDGHDELFERFEDRRLMPHLHLPLQSGSDTVLRRMGRRCSSKRFAELVRRARARIPDLNISTDVIAGFPGETAAQWNETLAFVERVGFSHVHVFPFSNRTGTAAARMSGQVDEAIRQRRSRILRQRLRHMKRGVLNQWVGRHTAVLLEGDGGSGVTHGYTHNYLMARFRCMPAGAAPGAIVQARLTSVAPGGDCLLAEPV